MQQILEFCDGLGVDLYIEILDDQLPIFSQSKLNNAKVSISPHSLDQDILTIRNWILAGYKIIIDDKAIRFIKDWFLRMPIQGECPLYRTDLYIESTGDVRTGCWVLPPVGNLKKEKLQDILEGAAFQENVQSMKNRRCKGCTCGYLMQSQYMQN